MCIRDSSRIEEMVEKAKKEVEVTIREEGEAATFDTGVNGLHPELVRLLGKLKYLSLIHILLKQTTTNCRSCEGSGRVFSVDWTAAKMRRETKTIFAGTICRKVLVKADARLLQVYLSNGFAEEMARVYGGEVLTESVANAAFGEFEIVRM